MSRQYIYSALLNLENQNRFDPLAKDSGTKAPQTGSDKDKFISGLKFVSINIYLSRDTESIIF